MSHARSKTTVVNFRLTADEKTALRKKLDADGIPDAARLVRQLILDYVEGRIKYNVIT